MTVRRQVTGAVLGAVPPAAIRRAAGPYFAGTTVEDAMRSVDALAQAGMPATVAVLGEAAATAREAEVAAAENSAVIDAVARRGAERDTHLGVKLTALGLEFDAQLATSHLVTLAAAADRAGVIVEVDMEQSAYVDQTLAIVRSMRERFSGVHAVIQAELCRSLADAGALIADRVPTRVVKGAYKEGAAVSYQLPEVIRVNYLACVRRFLEAGVPVGVATHDEYLIYRVLELAGEHAPAPFEFQMIMGIHEQLRSALVARGHPVRVTVSFGINAHRWAIRRLQENPALVRYGLNSLLPRRSHRAGSS
jgi:proline dehydrogenase